MPKVSYPPRYTPEEAATYGKAVIAKFTLPIQTIDSHSISTLLGITSAGDTRPEKVGSLIDWLIALEYLEISPVTYQRRQFLRLHDRWAGEAAIALAAFKNQFRGPLTGAVLARNKHYG